MANNAFTRRWLAWRRSYQGPSPIEVALAALKQEAKGWWDTTPTTLKTDAVASFAAASGEYLSRAASGLTHDAFTFAAWVKLGSTADFRNIAGVYNVTGNQRGWFLRTDITTGLLSAYLYSDGVTGGMASSSASVPVGSWAHVCVTNDGANIHVYVDGVSGPAMPYTGGVFDSSANFQVGSRGDASFPFEGEIGLASYWSRALSAAEVATLSASQLPYASLSTAQKVNMESFWHMNEGAASMRYDAHGANHLLDNNSVGVAAGPLEYRAPQHAAISKWTNQGGNASPFGDLLPVTLGGVSVLGGKPTFVSSYLRTNTGSLAQPASVCVVYKRTGAAATQHILDSHAATGARIAMVRNTTGNQIYAGAFLGSGGASLNVREVAIAQYNGASSKRIIGDDVDTGNTGTAGISGVSVGGGTLTFAGEIERVILLDREFTDPEITALQTL